jgi:hypothetical protein
VAGAANAGTAGEPTAQALSRKLYPHAHDADGSFHLERLSATEPNTLIALFKNC